MDENSVSPNFKTITDIYSGPDPKWNRSQSRPQTTCSPRNSPWQLAIAKANSVVIVITLTKILPRSLFCSNI